MWSASPCERERRFLELDEALWKYLGSLPASEVEQVRNSCNKCASNLLSKTA